MYISGLGAKLNSSGLGIDLQDINISAILFADDLVILGRSKGALDLLMVETRSFFRKHKLDISESKSKILSYNAATDKISFTAPNQPPLILDQVLAFKYLGIYVNCAPYNLFKSFNEQVRKRARNYLTSVMSLVRSGPNRSDLAYSLWTSCALPSILYGAEIIPLTKETVKEVEKYNTMVGKFILGIPRSSANVSSYIDAGLRPISSLIAERVLLYASSIMSRPVSYWPKKAMTENLSMGSLSPYTRYLIKWKMDTNCFSLLPKHIRSSVVKSSIIDILGQQRAVSTTTFALAGPGSGPSCSNSSWFKPKRWVSDSGLSQVFASFRSCNSGLGNRGPAKNGKFYKLCQLCAESGVVALNNEVKYNDYNFVNQCYSLKVHMVIECPKMNLYRASCGIGPFIAAHKLASPGLSSIKLYSLYLDDKQPDSVKAKAMDLFI